jgi:hypothetical protein
MVILNFVTLEQEALKPRPTSIEPPPKIWLLQNMKFRAVPVNSRPMRDDCRLQSTSLSLRTAILACQL